jgi:hypothetical protein
MACSFTTLTNASLPPHSAYKWDKTHHTRRIGVMEMHNPHLCALFPTQETYLYPCQEIVGPVEAHRDGNGSAVLDSHMSMLYLNSSGSNTFIFRPFDQTPPFSICLTDIKDPVFITFDNTSGTHAIEGDVDARRTLIGPISAAGIIGRGGLCHECGVELHCGEHNDDCKNKESIVYIDKDKGIGVKSCKGGNTFETGDGSKGNGFKGNTFETGDGSKGNGFKGKGPARKDGKCDGKGYDEGFEEGFEQGFRKGYSFDKSNKKGQCSHSHTLSLSAVEETLRQGVGRTFLYAFDPMGDDNTHITLLPATAWNSNGLPSGRGLVSFRSGIPHGQWELTCDLTLILTFHCKAETDKTKRHVFVKRDVDMWKLEHVDGKMVDSHWAVTLTPL